jgi:hypothetical protein
MGTCHHAGGFGVSSEAVLHVVYSHQLAMEANEQGGQADRWRPMQRVAEAFGCANNSTSVSVVSAGVHCVMPLINQPDFRNGDGN